MLLLKYIVLDNGITHHHYHYHHRRQSIMFLFFSIHHTSIESISKFQNFPQFSVPCRSSSTCKLLKNPEKKPTFLEDSGRAGRSIQGGVKCEEAAEDESPKMRQKPKNDRVGSKIVLVQQITLCGGNHQ